MVNWYPAPGTILVDRYEIRAFLGGLGVFDRSDGKYVTLDLLDASVYVSDPDALQIDLNRARRVVHPNVQQVLDAFLSPWGLAVVQENLPGQNLYVHMRKRRAQGGYPVEELSKLASDLCAGLAVIHGEGFVHGNLRPGSVMVMGDDTRAVILSSGFAQARALTATQPDEAIGGSGPSYMSPERLRNGDQGRVAGMSREDDVFALGLTLLEMWKCRAPEPGHPHLSGPLLHERQLDASAVLTHPELQQIFLALSEDPKMRPAASRVDIPTARTS